MRFRAVALGFALFFCAAGHSTWMHRALKSKNPSKINLVVLHLLHNENDFAAVDENGKTLSEIACEEGLTNLADWLHFREPEQHDAVVGNSNEPLREGTFPFPRDVAILVLRMIPEPSLQDAAAVRSTCKLFHATHAAGLAGRCEFDVRTTRDLVRLLALDGSPLLASIGTLRFEFGDGAVVPSFGVQSANMRATLRDMAINRADKFPPNIQDVDFTHSVTAEALLEFGHFLDRNIALLANVHTVIVTNGHNEWELEPIRPLVIRLLRKKYFISLRHLSLVRQPMREAFQRVQWDWHFEAGLAAKNFAVLHLEGLGTSTPTQLDMIAAAIRNRAMLHLQSLTLLSAPFSAPQIQALSAAIADGCLPNLREMSTSSSSLDPGNTNRLLFEALGFHCRQLRRLTLSSNHFIDDVVDIAAQGGFESLHTLDARACNWGILSADRALHLTFRSLQNLLVPCRLGSVVRLQNLEPGHCGLHIISLCGFDEVAQAFANADLGTHNPFVENPHLNLIRQLALWREGGASNPGLAEIIARSRNLMRFTLNYVYTDRDVHWLLWLTLGHGVDLHAPHAPLELHKLILFPPMAHTDAGALVRNYFQTGTLAHNRLTLPIDLGGHWVAVIIDLFDNAERAHILVYEIDERERAALGTLNLYLVAALEEALGHTNIAFEVVRPRRTNSPHCGAVMVANIVEAVSTRERPTENIVNIQQLRGEHYRLLRDNGEARRDVFQDLVDTPAPQALSPLSIALMISLLGTAQLSLRLR